MLSTFRALRAAAALALTLAGFASPALAESTTEMLSSGPPYRGERPVSRLYVYFFIDARPGILSDNFRQLAGAKLAAALQESGIPSEQLWFADTAYGKAVRKDLKSYIAHMSTFLSLDRTIGSNIVRETAFRPSHRLIVYPHETLQEEEGVVLNVKWDVIDAHTANYEWSVYSETTALSGTASPEQDETAAEAFVQAIMRELRARGVVAPAKGD